MFDRPGFHDVMGRYDITIGDLATAADLYPETIAEILAGHSYEPELFNEVQAALVRLVRERKHATRPRI
jgi:hypothetical protein